MTMIMTMTILRLALSRRLIGITVRSGTGESGCLDVGVVLAR